MQKIRVELAERSYNIVIDGGSLHGIGKMLKRFEFSRRLALVSNPTVYGLYGNTVSRSIKSAGFDLVEVSPPYDHGDITSVLASNIVFEYLSLLALKPLG